MNEPRICLFSSVIRSSFAVALVLTACFVLSGTTEQYCVHTVVYSQNIGAQVWLTAVLRSIMYMCA